MLKLKIKSCRYCLNVFEPGGSDKGSASVRSCGLKGNEYLKGAIAFFIAFMPPFYAWQDIKQFSGRSLIHI